MQFTQVLSNVKFSLTEFYRLCRNNHIKPVKNGSCLRLCPTNYIKPVKNGQEPFFTVLLCSVPPIIVLFLIETKRVRVSCPEVTGLKNGNGSAGKKRDGKNERHRERPEKITVQCCLAGRQVAGQLPWVRSSATRNLKYVNGV